MRIKLLLAVVAMLLLPIAFPHSKSTATTAVAGRTQLGGYCTCGAQECICDPGELPQTRAGITRGQKATSTTNGKSSEFELASGASILALVLLLWLRVRV
jgi:hypothetical protein